MSKDYEPYGAAWCHEVMKLPKEKIVDLLKGAVLLHSIEHRDDGATARLYSWHIGTRTQLKRGTLVTTYEILDNYGSIIAELPDGIHSRREQLANAEQICNAVNGRNYLLDLCGRLAQRLQQARLAGFGLPNEEPLLREAALAIREAAK